MEPYLQLHYQQQHLLLNPEGGGIVSYYLTSPASQKKQEVIYGYIERPRTGSMGDILFPFPGRVERSQYVFQGQSYTLSELKVKDGHAIHGFAKLHTWHVLSHTPSSAQLRYTLAASEYAARGFPFSLTLTLHYSLHSDGLSCQATIQNTGTTPAPFGIGFHPYFTLNTSPVDEWYLHLPATHQVENDNQLKPTGRLLDLTQATPSFQQPRKIGQQILDTCFTNLVYQQGRATTRLQDSHGRGMSIWQAEGLPYIQIYSGDTLAEPARRQALAIEPQSCTGFAFNLPHLGQRVLPPKASFSTQWGVIPDPTLYPSPN